MQTASPSDSHNPPIRVKNDPSADEEVHEQLEQAAVPHALTHPAGRGRGEGRIAAVPPLMDSQTIPRGLTG